MEEYMTVSFRMPRADHLALKEAAKSNDRDVTGQLNRLIKNYLRDREAYLADQRMGITKRGVV